MTEGDAPPTVLQRVRYRIAEQSMIVVAALLVVAVLLGYVAVTTHTSPATTIEQREVASWSANGSFTHQATVQNGSLAFHLGETLHNRTFYYTRATPELDGTYAFEYDGDAEDVTVTTDVALVVRSVDRSGEQPDELWNVTRHLTTEETRDLAVDEVHTATFSINVSRQQAILRQVEKELGTSIGSREIIVVADTEVSRTLAGEPQTVSRRDVLRTEPTDRFYRVSADIEEGHGDTVMEQVEVPVERDALPAYGAPIVALVALAGALGLVYLDRTDRIALPPGTRAAIDRRRERGRFEEWISAGRATIADDDRVVEMDSLEDLVDVAIDASKRVVYDDGAGWYVVIDGDVVYRYVEGGGADPLEWDRGGNEDAEADDGN